MDAAGLASFLGGHAPFDDLPPETLAEVAGAARIAAYGDGAEIVDAFEHPRQELYVVLDGHVDLWNSRDNARPDERLTAGGVFGFSALLTRRSVGPRAVAVGATTVAVLPSSAVEPAFSSSGGARFLAESMSRRAPVGDPSYGVVDELITRVPIVVGPDAHVDDVARAMTERDTGYAAVDVGDGTYGLITDTVLRRNLIVPGLPADTRVGDVMAHPALTTQSGDSAAGALIMLLDRQADFVLVVDRDGRLRGAAAPSDFAVSSTTAGVALRQQLTRAANTDDLVERARRVPAMVADLLSRGLPTSKVLAVYSATVDAIVRRALVLSFADHPDLDLDAFTWLSLGSSGRREAVLSSDLDSAVAFARDVEEAERQRYRKVFVEVERVIAAAGLGIDTHGATASRPPFSRDNGEWRQAARDWLADPVAGQGAIMTSLLVDGRAIHGDPGLPAVTRVFADLRSHPGTMRLLLTESLAQRAKLRSVRDVLARRGGTFDVKTHALVPIVNIARWAALSVGSSELQTTERLRAAAGSPMLPDDSADVLVEVFEVLQRIRLRHQLSQRERDHQPSDIVTMHRLSPIDRSVIGQAVREISAVQKRMDNVAQYVPTDEWSVVERQR
ncbi:putative nucleotidyltransferase substrate binding domain-containing protein [Jatrophihabitans endophyticus]|nr:putative nucleotidyltransferase substrate binding domain-containing protein [Jatrophihabitans endophyticus]